MQRLSLKIIGLFMAVLLGACTSVPISTMVKLRKFDIATTDTSKLRVGVRAPENIDIEKDGATMLISMWSGEKENKYEHKFILERLTNPGELAELQREHKPGFALHVFRLNPKDTDIMTDFRARHKKLKARFGNKTHGSIAISAQGCYRKSKIGGVVLMTTYLKSAEIGEFITLTREADVGSYLNASKIKKELPVCSSG